MYIHIKLVNSLIGVTPHALIMPPFLKGGSQDCLHFCIRIVLLIVWLVLREGPMGVWVVEKKEVREDV